MAGAVLSHAGVRGLKSRTGVVFVQAILRFETLQCDHQQIGNHAADHNVIQAARFSFAFVGRWLRAEPVQELYRMFREQRILL